MSIKNDFFNDKNVDKIANIIKSPKYRKNLHNIIKSLKMLLRQPKCRKIVKYDFKNLKKTRNIVKKCCITKIFEKML